MLGRVSHQLPLLDAKRAGTELFGAPRLNAFTLVNPNENTLSRIIGDLLDPGGTHGQGAVFLNALLDRSNRSAPVKRRSGAVRALPVADAAIGAGVPSATGSEVGWALSPSCACAPVAHSASTAAPVRRSRRMVGVSHKTGTNIR